MWGAFHAECRAKLWPLAEDDLAIRDQVSPVKPNRVVSGRMAEDTSVARAALRRYKAAAINLQRRGTGRSSEGQHAGFFLRTVNRFTHPRNPPIGKSRRFGQNPILEKPVTFV
jgi:hypothetical protein